MSKTSDSFKKVHAGLQAEFQAMVNRGECLGASDPPDALFWEMKASVYRELARLSQALALVADEISQDARRKRQEPARAHADVEAG